MVVWGSPCESRSLPSFKQKSPGRIVRSGLFPLGFPHVDKVGTDRYDTNVPDDIVPVARDQFLDFLATDP